MNFKSNHPDATFIYMCSSPCFIDKDLWWRENVLKHFIKKCVPYLREYKVLPYRAWDRRRKDYYK